MASPPPSTGFAAVPTADCVEPLLHFVLSSSHELDLCLSQDYCAQLLAHDPSLSQSDRLRYLLHDSHGEYPPISSFLSFCVDILMRCMALRHSWLCLVLDGAGDSGGGVPSYPLYKQVASALSRCMRGASIRRSDDSGQSIRGGGSLQEEKIESWEIMIAEKGLELENVCVCICPFVTFTLTYIIFFFNGWSANCVDFWLNWSRCWREWSLIFMSRSRSLPCSEVLCLWKLFVLY